MTKQLSKKHPPVKKPAKFAKKPTTSASPSPSTANPSKVVVAKAPATAATAAVKKADPVKTVLAPVVQTTAPAAQKPQLKPASKPAEKHATTTPTIGKIVDAGVKRVVKAVKKVVVKKAVAKTTSQLRKAAEKVEAKDETASRTLRRTADKLEQAVGLKRHVTPKKPAKDEASAGLAIAHRIMAVSTETKTASTEPPPWEETFKPTASIAAPAAAVVVAAHPVAPSVPKAVKQQRADNEVSVAPGISFAQAMDMGRRGVITQIVKPAPVKKNADGSINFGQILGAR